MNSLFSIKPLIKYTHAALFTTTMAITGTFLASTVAPSAAHAKAQTPAIDKNGIRVWETPVPNSNLLGFMAKATINASVEQVLAVVMDVPNSKEWIPRTKNAQAFPNKKVYMVIDMPFPLTDRELLLSAKITRDAKGSIKIANSLTNIASKPPNDDYIRIPKYSGEWYFQKLGKNKTAITITGYADPAGGLPSWVANMFVTDQPYEMLTNLKKQVKKPRYKNPNIEKYFK